MDLRSFWRDVIALPIVPLTLETHASRLRASESQVSRLRADQAQLRDARSASVQEAIWELARKWRMLGSHVGLLAFFVWAHKFGRKAIVCWDHDKKTDVVQEFGPWAVDFVAQTSCSRNDDVALACLIEAFPAHMADIRAGGDSMRQIRIARRE